MAFNNTNTAQNNYLKYQFKQPYTYGQMLTKRKMILGVDVGYGYTKDSNSNIFKSACTTKEHTIGTPQEIIINGITHYVGKGAMTSEVDKTNSKINEVCTQYALALNGDCEFYLVVGLPPGQYYDQRSALKKSILEYNNSIISFKGIEYSPTICEVTVAPQAVASLYSIPDFYGEAIVIDIGGGTMDVCLVEFNSEYVDIEKMNSVPRGLRTIMPDIAEVLMNEYKIKPNISDVEKYLKYGLTVDGNQVDLAFTETIFQNHVEEFTEEVKLTYPVKTVPIFLVGGGAILLQSYFKKHFHNVSIVPDPQFANARGYGVIGRNKYSNFLL